MKNKMKRREFINKTALMAGVGMMATYLPVEAVFAAEKRTAFPVQAYDDNRVVRVYDRRAVNYDFSGYQTYWRAIDPVVLRAMLAKSLSEISGESSEEKSWKKILGGNKSADLSARKSVVKVNFNNTIRDINTTLNNSPAMMCVLVESLLKAGLKQENICLFDCSRPFPDDFKKLIRGQGLEQVVMMGKTDSIPVSKETVFLPDNQGHLRDGKPTDHYPLPQCLLDADYLINLHLVKIHYPGVTGAMKNLFGLSEEVGFYMHLPAVKGFPENHNLPDLSLDENIKQRARLNIAEFLFGGLTPDTVDKFTNAEFFPDGLPCSLVVSRSPFYHDSVLYDFIRAEYQTCVPLLKRFKAIGPDTWLQNSASRYEPWKYEHAQFVNSTTSGLPPKDLAFGKIDYVSISNTNRT